MSQDAWKQVWRPTYLGSPLSLFIVLLLFCLPRDVSGQEQRYTVSFQDIPLADALRQVAEKSPIPLVYSTNLVSPHKADCEINNQLFEDLLKCVLQESELDYIRLPSGTYVIKERKATEPLYGYFTGTVVDQERGVPIPDAHILLTSEHGTLGSTTNNAGQFIFPKLVAGNYVVSTSHITYESWQDSIIVFPERHTQHDIRLQPESILISPIIIDGLQHRLHLMQLDNEEVRADGEGADKNPSALLKKVETLVGVSVSDATADIHLLGAQTGAHQLRLNGAPIFLPRNAVGIISPISTFALSKLKIHKAGFGAHLGNQTAGVIEGEYNLDMANRLTLQADQHSLNLRLQRYAIPTNQGSMTFMLALRQSIWNLSPPSALKNTISNWGAPDFFQLVAPGRLYLLATENILTQSSSQLRPDLSFNFSDLHGATQIRLNTEETITASFYAGRTELDSGNTLFVTAPPLSAGITSRDKYAWRYNVGQIRYNYLISGRFLLSGQVRFSETTIDHSYGASLSPLTEDNQPSDDPELLLELNGENFDDSNRINELGGEASLDFALNAHHIQIGVETAITQSRFRLLLFKMIEQPTSGSNATNPDGVFIAPYVNLNRSETERFAFFAQDQISLGANWEASLGVRATLFHHTLYSEPRFSIRYDHSGINGRAFSSKTSIGMYRQFINQTDISNLNSLKLLPTTRIWFPIDHTVTPPHTTLISQAIAWKPRPSWVLRLEGYINFQGEELVMDYQAPSTPEFFDIENYDRNLDGLQESLPANIQVLELEQQEFLTNVQSRKHGVNAVVGWNKKKLKTELHYSYSHATRKGEGLFENQTHTVPWNEPHRASIQVSYMPSASLAATIRTKSIWGRSWGFQRAYYDYFGNRASTRYRLNNDFGTPSDHVLPPLHQLDISVAYTYKLEKTEFQLRLDLLNALGRKNVIDWRLVYQLTTDTLTRRPRYLHGVLPIVSFSARF